MKKTKIILSVILCITVLVTLCACTRGNGDDTTTTEPPTSAEYKTEIFEEPKQLEEVGLTYNDLSLIHISEPTRPNDTSRMPSSA